MSFDVDAIVRNVEALVEHIRRAKPPAAKGQYFQKATLSATMMPGLPIDTKTLPIGV